MERRKSLALEEVKLLYALKGHTNIVSYEDRVTQPWNSADAFGVDLLIRMELLQDLRKKINSGVIFPESEIIKIGKDICNALMLCHRKNILHRDIKPENIFFNKNGDYKLGDFGVSRILDGCRTTKASTGIGTPEYAAPEQGSGSYDKRVDIYSLGLVLYELSNGNRLPFATSSYVKEVDIQRRLAAKELPKPAYASAELAKVIQKACALRPGDRYQTAKEMAAALDSIGIGDSKNTARETSKSKSADAQRSASYGTKPATPKAENTKNHVFKNEAQETAKSKTANQQGSTSYGTKPATPKEAQVSNGSKRDEKTSNGCLTLIFCVVFEILMYCTLVWLSRDENSDLQHIRNIAAGLAAIVAIAETFLIARKKESFAGDHDSAMWILMGGLTLEIGGLVSHLPVWELVLFILAINIRTGVAWSCTSFDTTETRKERITGYLLNTLYILGLTVVAAGLFFLIVGVILPAIGVL